MTDNPEDKKTPITKLIPVANIVDFESQKGAIKMTFFVSALDPKVYPDCIMKITEVVVNKELALQIAGALTKHANRGDISVLDIKRTPLPTPEEIIKKVN